MKRWLLLLLLLPALAAIPSHASKSKTCQLVNVTPPKIHGKAELGKTLHASRGVWREVCKPA